MRGVLRWCARLCAAALLCSTAYYLCGLFWEKYKLCPLLPEVLVPWFAREWHPYALKLQCCSHAHNLTLDALAGLQDRGRLNDIVLTIDSTTCTTVDFIACKLVVVTAASSSHYLESLDAVAAVRYWLPNTSVVYYNLGLSANQVRDLSLQPNVQVIPFPHQRYPPYFRHILKFAWKVAIVHEMLQQYEVVYWMDASIRLRRSPTDTVLRDLKQFPFRASREKWAASCLTVDSTIKYLNLTREDLGHTLEVEAGHVLFRRTPFALKRIMEPWFDCAMHEECIAPENSVKRCNFDVIGRLMRDHRWQAEVPHSGGGCHRFDQSALTLVLIRELGITNREAFTYPMFETEVISRRPTSCYVKQ